MPLALSLEELLRQAVRDKLPRARVVLDESGRTPPRQVVLHQFKKYLRGAGLKERSFHSLRHYFISELMRGGASAEAVRVLAGHSKLEMTQRYAHTVPADLRAAIDRLGNRRWATGGQQPPVLRVLYRVPRQIRVFCRGERI